MNFSNFLRTRFLQNISGRLLLEIVSIFLESLIKQCWALKPSPNPHWYLYSMSAKYREDLVYFTTRVPDMNDTSATRTTRVLHEGHEWKRFDFDNDTSENIFSHPYISYIADERLQGEEQFHSKNYLLEMPRSHAKMRLKSTPKKLNFVTAKAISKSYTLDYSCKWPCTFPHSYG